MLRATRSVLAGAKAQKSSNNPTKTPFLARRSSEVAVPVIRSAIDSVVTEGPSNRPVGRDHDIGVALTVMHLTEDIETLRVAAKIPEDGLCDGIE